MSIENYLDTSDIDTAEEMQQRAPPKPLNDEPQIKTNIWSTKIESIDASVFTGEKKLKIETPATAHDYFSLLFTDVLYQFLLKQVNKRIRRQNDVNESRQSQRRTSLPPKIAYITITELKKYIAIVIYMGICKLPEIRMYWQNIKTGVVGQKPVQNLMTYKRFTEINTNFGFNSIQKTADNEKRDIDKSVNKIVTYLNALFYSVYSPGECLSIDEGMCKFQGRYGFKTYMPAKPIKVGMKFFLLADSESAFICQFKLYTGKSSTIKTTVKDLMNNYLHANHKLYMDNFYNSFELCREMRTHGVFCCGTMRSCRGEPEEYRSLKCKMKKGDLYCNQKDGVNILLWYDKKVCSFITTFSNFEPHLIANKYPVKNFTKPEMICDYDKNMGGVDTYDQMLHTYFNERKSRKWSYKLANYIINLVTHNSYILYKHFYDGNDKHGSQLKFRLALFEFLSSDEQSNILQTNSTEKDITMNVNHTEEAHYPFKYLNKNKRCKNCSHNNEKKRRMTMYYCGKCLTALCIEPCFREWHMDREFNHSETESSNLSKF